MFLAENFIAKINLVTYGTKDSDITKETPMPLVLADWIAESWWFGFLNVTNDEITDIYILRGYASNQIQRAGLNLKFNRYSDWRYQRLFFL